MTADPTELITILDAQLANLEQRAQLVRTARNELRDDVLAARRHRAAIAATTPTETRCP